MKKLSLILYCCLMIVFSCKRNDYVIDVSHIDLDLEIQRFEKDFENIEKKDFVSKMEEIHQKNPAVYTLFVERILRAGRVHDSNTYSRLKRFLEDPYTRELYKDVALIYSDIDAIEAELEQAYKHVKYYFADSVLPDIYTMISNFGYTVVGYENMICIGLDMFLGADYKYYPSLFPDYKIRTLRSEYMIPEVMKVDFGNKFPEESYSGSDLLSQMIYNGKMLFYLDLMLPRAHDSIRIQYKKDQLQWCRKNEALLWDVLLNEKYLYETEGKKVFRFFNDGPFTNVYGIPQESPPRLGEWIGWQIVRNYVEQVCPSNPVEVFYEKDIGKILRLSKYKPKS
jgi:hypothetical protein